MKKLINLIVLLCIVICNINAQSNSYYYYKGEKVYLTIDKSKVNITTSNSLRKSSYIFADFKEFDLTTNSFHGLNSMFGKLEFITTPNDSVYFQKINSLKADSNIISISPYFITSDTSSIGTSSIFYVKLKNINDYQLLESYADTFNVDILTQNEFMPLWYLLSTNKNTQSNSIEIANLFYETGLFAEIDPAFIFNFQPNCSNDPKFNLQWGLYNNQNSDIDINACDAWNITQGEGINIAVIDNGTDKTHNDLATNIHPLSFNALSGESPSMFYTGDITFSHGTHVAGIIGAIRNNSLHVTGVSPKSKLMIVSHTLNGERNDVRISYQLASGITWAWQNGADVINNSWGDKAGYVQGLHSTILDNAINDALLHGRNEKGTVVVFAAGNNGVLDYPANSNPDIICVGSIHSSGQRASGSGDGAQLDIVAPGAAIYSTMPNNQSDYLSGTSMAAPHISGVASLILSVNPNLTQKQVANIIESTAQKIGGYNYAYNPNYPNGTWNNQMGYGLVDAYAAVQMAKCYKGENVLSKEITTNTNVTINTFASEIVTIKSGTTLTVTSTLYMAPDARIIVEPGAKLIVNGGTITSACPDEFWGAIFVMGNRNQPQTQQYQGYVELNNATIENARNAISTWYPDDWNTTGGIIKATNTTFRNNLRSVEFLSYNNSNQGSFTNCTFSWDENLFAHEKSQLTHVTMYDVTGVEFTKCYFSKDYKKEEENIILTHGILSEKSGFEVKGRFEVQDMKKSMFNNLDYGVRAGNSNNKIFKISNSIFNYNSCGVFASIANNFKVTESNFNIRPDFDPIVNPNVDYIKMIAIGISSDKSTGYTIEKNNFNGISFDGQSYPPANTVGIGISNSGSDANAVNNNTFNNLYGGSQALGTNRKDNNNGIKTGLQYFCNNFNNSLYGLYVTKYNTINPDIYGICEEQRSLSIPALNFFNNNGTDICNSNCPKIYYSFSSNISNIQPSLCNDNVYLVDIGEAENSCGTIGNTKTKDQWYYDRDVLRDQYALLLFNYNNLLDGGQKDELLDQLQKSWDGDVWAVREEYLAASPYLSVEVLREMVQGEKLPLAVCTEILLSNPEATQKDEFKEFMYKKEQYLTPLSISLIEESWEEKTFRANMESNISAKFTELEMASRTLISIILSDSLGINLEEYRTVLSEMKSPETRFELSDSYIDKKEYSKAREALSALQDDKNYIEEAERYLQYIDLVEKVGSPYDLSEETLLSLAETNDAIGIKAKSILYFSGKKTDYHPIVVNMENEPKSKPVRIQGSLSDLSDADITIVPNPAKDHITITYNLPPKQIYTLKIYDNKGIELLSKTLNSNKGMQTIELKTLKSGTYYYTITDSKSVVKSDKIIIVK